MAGSKGGAWRLHPRAVQLRKLVWVGSQGGARRPAHCARSNGDVCMVRERLNASICATLGDATGRAAAPCQDARVLPARILQSSRFRFLNRLTSKKSHSANPLLTRNDFQKSSSGRSPTDTLHSRFGGARIGVHRIAVAPSPIGACCLGAREGVCRGLLYTI